MLFGRPVPCACRACDKRPWLEGLNNRMEWPMSCGKPRLLRYLDNAVAEFKEGEALRRGCEASMASRLDYRRLGSRTTAARSWNGSIARRCR